VNRLPRHRRRAHVVLLLLLFASLIGGCGAPGFQKVKPTQLNQAVEQVPENQLLDVGVAITEAPKLTDKQLDKQGTTADIRESERHFIPFHLKNTLQMSSYWGTVQVIPPEDDSVDLKVSTELVRSNGEYLQLIAEAKDASGRVWLRRKYIEKARVTDYDDTSMGEHEAYQDLYNTLANDLSSFKSSLTPDQVEEIRTVSKLKFAKSFAPDAFDTYLEESGDGSVVVVRIPSDDDPLMLRIDAIRGREQMLIDTLNQYYEGYYMQMWDAYENWRRFYLTEQEALRQAQKDALVRTIAGVAMIAAAVALQAGDVSGAGALSGILILGGGQVVVSGIEVSKQKEIHAAAIQELADSFGTEMRPTVIELEGKRYELTGTAEEQYAKWRELLKQIYFEETGFDPASEPPPAST